MRILLTGFQPFGSVEINPSQLIIEHFQVHERTGVVALVLPTEYQAAGEGIKAAIREFAPDAIILLGVAQNRTTISLERVAINLDDASIPDNSGVLLCGELISGDGPAAYWSTLPLQAMYRALETHNIPVSMSNHAGTYICNHVFYVAQHLLSQTGNAIPVGFIHVPALAVEGEATDKGLRLDTMIEAVKICLDVLREHVQHETPLSKLNSPG